MKKYKDITIIGVDHGYGNIKTANNSFRTGAMKSDKEPVFKEDLLVWNGHYYIIGAGHKMFTADKIVDEDYYVMTLAAVAAELSRAGIHSADVFLAAGLPLTWVSEQREDFKRYLLQNSVADFVFRNKAYHVRFVGAEIYPQGFAAVVNNIGEFNGINMICDIGNGTMNVMYMIDKKPDPSRCYTEKFGTHQCMIQARENIMRIHHAEAPEEMVTQVLRTGSADIAPEYLETIRSTAKEYTDGIFRRLGEHGYEPKLMRLYVVGGGGCLVRNFAEYDDNRVIINEDICANAKGYERMAELKLAKGGGY